MNTYDVVVIGAGHAGIEASLACARMDCRVLLLTLNPKNIGLMSCNPAIGGVGKGQLVKEIDALGGEMAKAADACGIQFRILNASKGPAVQSSRCQIDMELYKEYMQGVIKSRKDISIKQGEAKSLLVKDGRVIGVVIDEGEEVLSKAVIICVGTFLDGLIHLGLRHFSGGRINEPASINLTRNLEQSGFNLLRFKTGTCPRLDKKSIDFSCLKVQDGDNPPKPFSFSTKKIPQKQVPCYITYTNENTHKIIRDNLDKSPLYTGKIKASGVRYCPSIEDKVVKFADKIRHQVFLEPEGYESGNIYPNGLSTSLPEETQLEVLRSIAGLEQVRVVRFGYGIEHTVVEPTQLYPTLETKRLKNLYLAGQINGTTGYEEAAAQGLLAGINAALRIKGREGLILDRAASYIGVLIDDLTTKGTNEPYRMFTSRVEYRLILREDNADLRLRKIGYNIGLVNRKDYLKSENKIVQIKEGINILKNQRLKPSSDIPIKIRRPSTLEELLKRPEVNLKDLIKMDGLKLSFPDAVLRQIEIETKYAGFIQRQLAEVDRFKDLEKVRLPLGLDYSSISGLSAEIKEKLNRFKPLNLGQASRISGVTPAAVSILMIYLRKVNPSTSLRVDGERGRTIKG